MNGSDEDAAALAETANTNAAAETVIDGDTSPAGREKMYTDEENDDFHKKEYFYKDKEEDADAVDNRNWRANFLNGHNATPSELANSVFPTPFRLSDHERISQLYKMASKHADGKKKGHKSKDQVPAGKQAATREKMALAQHFVHEMRYVGIEVDWIKSTMKHWVKELCAPILDGSGNPILDPASGKPSTRPVNNQRFDTKQSGAVLFFCKKCMSKVDATMERFGLVAVCTIRRTAAEDEADDALPQHEMVVDSLYYHSRECDQKLTAPLLNYANAGHVAIPVHMDWIFGKRYEDLIKKIDDHPKAGVFFKRGIEKGEKKAVLDEIGLQKSDDSKVYALRSDKYQDSWSSYGELINYANWGYRYDDRSYLLLPGEPAANPTWRDHRMSMARLIYAVVSHLGIEDEASPFVWSPDYIVAWWFAHNRKKKETSFTQQNPRYHLSLTEVSALFGGNEREIAGKDVIHQYCHVDGGSEPFNNEVDVGQGEKVKLRFAPGSIMVPLTKNGREIYLQNTNRAFHVPYGHAFLFKSDLPHGGITRRNDKGLQNPAIHGHFDSVHHERKQAFLSLSNYGQFYLPKEHFKLYEVSNYLQCISNQRSNLANLIENIADTHNKELGKLVTLTGEGKAGKEDEFLIKEHVKFCDEHKGSSFFKHAVKKHSKCCNSAKQIWVNESSARDEDEKEEDGSNQEQEEQEEQEEDATNLHVLPASEEEQEPLGKEPSLGKGLRKKKPSQKNLEAQTAKKRKIRNAAVPASSPKRGRNSDGHK